MTKIYGNNITKISPVALSNLSDTASWLGEYYQANLELLQIENADKVERDKVIKDVCSELLELPHSSSFECHLSDQAVFDF